MQSTEARADDAGPRARREIGDSASRAVRRAREARIGRERVPRPPLPRSRMQNMNEPLPVRRQTVRQKVRIGGTKLYVDVGFYPDGRPGEVFIVAEKTGAERRWHYDEIARLASKLIQRGASLEEVAEGWLWTRGKICGPVQGHPQIKSATSMLDFVARMLLVDYCGRTDLAHMEKGTP